MATIKLNQDGQWITLADDSNAIKHSPQDLTSVQQSQARNNIGVFTQPTQPTAANEGDIWFDTSKNFVDTIYPVGSIYMSVSSTSPASLFGGTWEQLKDRFLLGAGNTYSNGATGGEATHTLIVSEMPNHGAHLYTSSIIGTGTATSKFLGNMSSYGSVARGWVTPASNEYYPAGQSLGGGAAHNNMPPYLAVYMWKRTA